MRSNKILFGFLIVLLISTNFAFGSNGEKDRKLWINALTKIADPVLINLSQNTLRANMPVEVVYAARERDREKVTHLEAVGRLICGISPWLELGPDETKEGKMRAKYIKLCIAGLKNGLDPNSPDFLNFTTDRQALVDAAFLAEGLLRAPIQLWSRLDQDTQNRLIEALKSTRRIKPLESNWLLFSAMVEAALLEMTGECKMVPITYALDKFDEWYKGDSWYGDGLKFHFDYYNSLVIHPMMTDIINVLKRKNLIDLENYSKIKIRSIRHSEQIERLISPEGTYPAIGRSLTYRFGVFHGLSQVALQKELPSHIAPSQVRAALTAVINNQVTVRGTFDKDGWLKLGMNGHQPELAETYISTGSLYLCTVVFLPLGLDEKDEFWRGRETNWTNKKIWSSQSITIDKALKN